MRELVLIGLLALLAGLAPKAVRAADWSPSLSIVSGGRTEYSIVIPDKAKPVVGYAASELQSFLEQSTGVQLPIVSEGQRVRGKAIYIGCCPSEDAARLNWEAKKLREDGVLIASSGRNLVLLGQNERGQLYSVYCFLERYLGVKFLAFDCTVVPKHPELSLPEIHYAYSPPFMYRETLYFDSFPKEIATRQRLNGPWTKCDESVGGKIAFYPYVHSFSKLVPPEKYYNEHPEYFSLVNGKRTKETVHGQLCLTNPDVLRIATEQVLKWIEENPSIPIIDVSQNDGNGACECEKCAAVVKEEGSQHGPILRFVNAIADVVAKKYPGKWVETLAYAYSTQPPAITKPRNNVIIRLCHAGCFFHGFETCKLGANTAGDLQVWSKRTQRIFVWHYTTNFAHYLAPDQNLDGLAKDIKYYAHHGVNGLMVQGDYQSHGGELAEIRQYLASQLMWDPSRDPMEIRREFCQGYYGSAAEDVMKFLALMDDLAKRPDSHAFAVWDPKTTAPSAFVAQGLEILGHAREKAESSEIRNRIGKLMLPLWYMRATEPQAYEITTSQALDTVKQMRSVAKACQITHVSETNGDMSGWLDQMEQKYQASEK